MAAKLLAAINRITLDDVIPGRAASKNTKNTCSASFTVKDDCDQGRESPVDESRYCKLCALKFNSEEQLSQHIKGKRHEKSLRRANLSEEEESKMAGYGYDDANSALQAMGDNSSDPVTKALIGNITGTLPRKRVLDIIRCDICSIDFNEKGQYQMHVEGKRHAKRQKLHDLVVTPPTAVQAEISVEADAVGKDGEPKTLSADGLNCFVCNISVNSSQMMETHLNGAKHKTKMQRVTKADIVRSAKAVADKKVAAATTAAAALAKGGATAMATAAAVVNGIQQTKKQNSEGTAVVDLHCEACGVHANSAQQWDQHVQSKKHKDKINPPPPHPNKPKPGGLAKPRINFVKANNDDNEFDQTDDSSATSSGWNGSGRGRGGRGGVGGRGSPMAGRGGGPPRGRGGWTPGGRGRARGGTGGPRGGYGGGGGGRGGGGGSYESSGDGGNYGGGGGSYGSGSGGYGGGNSGVAGSYDQQQYDGYSASYNESSYPPTSYDTNSSVGGGASSAAAAAAASSSYSDGGGGYNSGSYTDSYGGNANSSYGNNHGSGSAYTSPASTSAQPPSGYKVTPTIGSTFVKGKTLQSSYY